MTKRSPCSNVYLQLRVISRLRCMEQLILRERCRYDFSNTLYTRQVDSFETNKLLILRDDREDVSLPMDVLQKAFGEDAKLQVFAVDNSKVIVIMVDKNYDQVWLYRI